jgi:4-hydroxybenzoate polyprenyltransferase
MLGCAALLAIKINLYFFLTMAAYTLTTLTYSFILKRLQTLDILTLAALYTLRIIAGGTAASIQPSFWLLAFSMFIFFTLAIGKRISELINTGEGDTDTKLSGRGYFFGDKDVLTSLGTSSAMVSVLVFAMYINSDAVIGLYEFPYALWLVCPILAYWLTRILIMTTRGEVDEDPIIFALKDSRSWLSGIAIFAAILFAI